MIRNKRLKDTQQQRESPEWKLSIKLSPFFGTAAETAPSPSSPSPKSSRSFDDGAVGLGIVAAMSEARSEPIPIVSVVRPSRQKRKEEERMELSESYTCVIAHVGKGLVRKRVYFDHGGAVEEDELFAGSVGNQGMFYQSPARPPAVDDRGVCGGDFLSRCFLCRKNLHGLDIFMYRGDRAFCSEECRSHQIEHDEQREKHTRKQLPFNCSASSSSSSPCSAHMFFAAGLAAA